MTTLNLQVNASAGDSHMESVANDAGRVSTVSGVCVINAANFSPGSHGSGNEWWGGVRVVSVTIPPGATINSAFLTLTGAGTYNASPNVVALLVAAHYAANSAALTTTNGDLNNTARPQTTAVSATWTQTSVVLDTEYSIDITSVVQEVVNHPSWASGNAMTLLVCVATTTTVSEWQDYFPYDTSTTKAPKVSVDYTAGGSPVGPLVGGKLVKHSILQGRLVGA